eukprot:6486393-Amphidinium_carterae.1
MELRGLFAIESPERALKVTKVLDSEPAAKVRQNPMWGRSTRHNPNVRLKRTQGNSGCHWTRDWRHCGPSRAA